MNALPFFAFMGFLVWATVVAIAFLLVYRLVRAAERIADALDRETKLPPR